MKPHSLGHRFTESAEARLAEVSLAIREDIKRPDSCWEHGDVGTRRIRAGRRHQEVMLRPTQEHLVINGQAESPESHHHKRLLDRGDPILQPLRKRSR